MDNAVVNSAPAVLVPADYSMFGRLAALPSKSKVSLALGVGVLVAVLVTLALTTQKGEYRLLFPNLSDKDGGQVIEKLQQLNVPYRMADGNGAVLVPADRVYELRMKLTAAGLPKGGNELGYDSLDKTGPWGQTQRRETMSLQRAREGELVRTITTLESVSAARVHLAMPNQNGFFREQEKASASVVLTLHPGRTLDRAQLAGIVHLVSRSVPDLKAGDVSVIDSSGALLNPQEGTSGLDSLQIEYRQQIEEGHVRRVMELLEPVVGRDNLRATVTADIDFSQVEQTAEEYKPNQGTPTATVRAIRTEENSQPGAAVPSGVPGAASNQPPVPATAPLTGASAPLQTAQGGSTGASGRREAETRYEVDKTVRVVRGATGSVRRLNAAVVVNHRSTTDAKGKTSSTPLTPEELEKLTTLVQQGIGFSSERGDSVRVINVPFRIQSAPKADELPLWQQPWLQDLLRAGLAPAALALVALLAFFGFVRPAMKAALAPATPAPGSQLDTVVADDQTLPPLLPGQLPALEGPVSNSKLEAARRLAKDNPAAMASMMRTWVNGEVTA